MSSTNTMRVAERIVESPSADRHFVNRDRRRYRVRRTMLHALVGFAFGYVVLHPITMFVFDWLGAYPKGEPFLLWPDWLSRSFALEMVPMGLVFGVLTMAIGGVDGFYRSFVRFQRDELKRQNSALRALELSKRRTVRFLVHDLKNHAGCVLGYVNQLLVRAEKFEWSGADVLALKTIQRRATRMAGALKDILELARLEDQPRLQFETIPARDLLRRAVAETALGPGEGPVRIDAELTEDLTITCDPLLLERVVANLVLNAFKHNRPDVEVVVGVSRQGREVRFFCHDTGDGIPDAVRDGLFEEFASGARGGDHTPSYGLGLSFCMAAIKAHGGRIWFESAKDEGTTVLFSLPIRRDQGEST